MTAPSEPPPTSRPEWPDARTGWVEADGVRLACLETGPPDGPLAVLLHGFPDTPLTWRVLGPVLGEAGYRVVAPWQRGYPPSPAPDGAPYQVAALARDLLAVVRTLSPDRPAVVVGHDWGALATYGACVLGPDVLRRVVTLAVPPSTCFRTFLRTSWEQQQASWYQFFFQLPMADAVVAGDGFLERIWRSWSPGWEPDADLLAATVEAVRAGMPAPLTYYRHTWQPALQSPDLAADQQAIFAGPSTVPTLVLRGADDGCILAGAFDGLDGWFTGGVRLVSVPDAGHFVHLERPDAVRDLVLDFLGKD